MKSASQLETVKCPKCDGVGSIGAFSHIANGVCFCCGGNKTVVINRDELVAQLSSDTRIKAEWVLKSTESSYAGLSYGKLLKIRNFCHGGWGLQDAYPTLLAHWYETGEQAFQAAQELRHHELTAYSL